MLDYTTMRRFLNLVFCCAVGLLLAFGAAHALADQRDPRLPALFARLRSVDNLNLARRTELMIWKIWGETGKPELDKLMHDGERAMEVQDYAAAIATFSAVIAAKPDFAEGWNRRATVYYLSGDYDASLKDIEHVLELEPRHFGAISGLGVVNLARAHDAAARDAFERVLSLYPFNVPAQENLKLAKKRLEDSEI